MTKQTVLVSKSGRPKDQAKRKAVLEAAKSLFLSKGYEGSSMDAIAAEAGVSKLTVYNHYRDKATLFSAAITAKCDEQLPERLFEFSPHASIETVLLNIGIKYLELICSSEAVALQRVIVAMANQEPKLACMFYEAGARHMLREMTNLLMRASLAGRLRIEDPQKAAERFFCLLKGDDYFRVLIGICEPLQGEQAARHVHEVVTVFLGLHSCETPQVRAVMPFGTLASPAKAQVPSVARTPGR
ncbi:TetR family transcriptional regulator [Pseudomonas sp. AFG_SD02_1510_Pfu_092]|uniref:TetR/AcrR family transcriptional regulator n=1 Tax=Pseudomonas sp. AFG_SD02_1510_Pfu_092 TaxID=2259497 RepID=UPI000DF008DE|nr:TetR/AcrR family transcriptional regulator [Pseudomonas sp. AFG_SD02_1510_Pfu_092]RCL26041.1 TetR family transcriptional regulator [Pseudomonas sp. AFG_SD02_1510_Pfu_092]